MTDTPRPEPTPAYIGPDGNLYLSQELIAELIAKADQQPVDNIDMTPHTAPSLPHPVAVRHNASLAAVARQLESSGWAERLADPEFREREIGEHICSMFNAHPQPYLAQWRELPRAIYASVCLSHARRGGVILQATDALEALLSHTDIDASLPTSMFVPPCPALYLHFGPRWRARIRSLLGPALALAQCTPDEVTPHGCYLMQTRYFCEACGRDQRNIGLYLVVEFNEQPGHYVLTGGADDVLHDEDAPLRETMVGKFDGGVPGGVMGDMPSVLVDLLAKLFLYMQTDAARVVGHDEYSALMQRLSLVGSKKQGKLQRRAERLYDWQEVGPVQLPADFAPSAPDRRSPAADVSPHWRRGHLRQQPHGPNHALRKVVFIAPTMVRADRLVAAPKEGEA